MSHPGLKCHENVFKLKPSPGLVLITGLSGLSDDSALNAERSPWLGRALFAHGAVKAAVCLGLSRPGGPRLFMRIDTKLPSTSVSLAEH